MTSAKEIMKKWLRLAVIAAVIAVLAVTVLSLSVFGEGNSVESVTPESDVFTVENAEQLIFVFQNLGSSSVPASSTIKLANDIDVDGKLPMAMKAFTGVFDGNGKTISGITDTLFKQFNGTAKNLTLRGKIDITAETDNSDNRTTATFALKTAGATLTDVISYVDLKAGSLNIQGGGLIGYADKKNILVGCEYHGEMTISGDGSVGGIVGYANPDETTLTFDGCYFGGKINATYAGKGGTIYIGGILGRSESPAASTAKGTVSFINCVSNGTITSSVVGYDIVGGIFGSNDGAQNSIEHCANKSNITAVKHAGGILGSITVNTKIINCTNFGEITAENAGEFCGVGNGKNFTCFSSYGFSKSDIKICSTDFTANSSYQAKDISLERAFSLGNTEYEQYNVCTIEKATGLTVVPLRTTKMFEAYVSTREDGDTQALRFVILTNCTCPAASITVSIQFKDYGGKVIKSYTGKLGGKDGDLTLYGAVAASGENYFAAEGFALFGCVITEVPIGLWDSVELTVKDTENGTEYLEPVRLEGYSGTLTMEDLPDFSTLGTVSELYNCGPGLLSDKEGTTEEDSYMTVISETSKEKFEAYLETLSDAGFAFVSKTTLDGDDYYSYAKNGKLLYLYYNERVKEIRLITDNSSDSLSRINYDYEPKAGEQAEFYQYSINYSDHDKEGYDPVIYTESGMLDCGMMYMMKTADNKIIMIDGGHSGQFSNQAKKHMLNYMREITGTPKNEKVTIAAWFITHAHGDHVAVARDFLNGYSNQINLESVIYNFPLYGVVDGYDDNTFGLKEAIRNHYSDALYHKLHTGEVLNIGGIRMEVVYTHEDAVSPKGNTELGEFNSSSTVLKVMIEDKSFMILGDLYYTGANTVLKFHSKAYLKSDVLQVAHHGYNNIGSLYQSIRADIALFPNSMFKAKEHDTYNTVMAFSKEAYFAHKWTYKFTVENGEIKVTEIKRYDQK